MIPFLLLAALVLYHQGQWAFIALLALPVAVRVGSRHAIRRTGVSMVRTGAHRIVRGKL